MRLIQQILSVDVLLQKYYYSKPRFVDGTTEFHRLCGRYIQDRSRILEIGPGPANRTSTYLSTIGPVIGVDVTAEIAYNAALSSAYVTDNAVLPFGDKTFDACVSNFVVEHISDTRTHFCEVARVLKPGGVYCFRTPNLWHYVAMGARIVPYTVHRRLANKLRGLAADAHSPYPTFYRGNTSRSILALCHMAGLQTLEINVIEKEPSYGKAHAALFYAMMLYERVVNRSALLCKFRANILAVVQR